LTNNSEALLESASSGTRISGTRSHQFEKGSVMSELLVNRIKLFLKALEPLQDSTLALFDRKRGAVMAADPEEMLRLAGVEADLTRQMHETLGARREILLEAKRAGHDCGSILELASTVGTDEHAGLTARIRAARRKSERIRRESWAQWVISQRANTYYNELLELIAYSGKKAPVYSDKPVAPSSGGTILDASA
jgi:hypothetical protein